MNCKKCNTEMSAREVWPEIDGEYRHLEYLYCPTCNVIYTLKGDPIICAENKETNADDTLKWVMGCGSHMSVGIDPK